jgi:hypothetical protein
MASSEDARGRALTRVLRASIPAVAAAACLGVLAACGSPTSTANSPKPNSATPAPTSSASSGGAQPAAVDPTQATAPGTVPAKPPTVHQFTPFDENGRRLVHARAAGHGSCFATSIAVPVAGVFRCLIGNTILDPCFASARESTPATVACFADPWSTGQIITLTHALPKYDPVLTEGNPWAIVLADGRRCVSVTGAVPALGDVDLTYRCDGNDAAGITVNDDGTVTAHYGPSTGPLADTAVLDEWRGRSFRFAGTP